MSLWLKENEQGYVASTLQVSMNNTRYSHSQRSMDANMYHRVHYNYMDPSSLQMQMQMYTHNSNGNGTGGGPFYDVPVDSRRSQEKKNSETYKFSGSPTIRHEDVHTSPNSGTEVEVVRRSKVSSLHHYAHAHAHSYANSQSRSDSETIMVLDAQVQDLRTSLETLKKDYTKLEEKLSKLENERELALEQAYVRKKNRWGIRGWLRKILWQRMHAHAEANT